MSGVSQSIVPNPRPPWMTGPPGTEAAEDNGFTALLYEAVEEYGLHDPNKDPTWVFIHNKVQCLYTDANKKFVLLAWLPNDIPGQEQAIFWQELPVREHLYELAQRGWGWRMNLNSVCFAFYEFRADGQYKRERDNVMQKEHAVWFWYVLEVKTGNCYAESLGKAGTNRDFFRAEKNKRIKDNS